MLPSDLTADLPAPRDDEPESLRADIVDELSDHLQCAVRREELRTGIEPWGSAPRDAANDGGAEPRRSPAYERALARFGDPRVIARKLWWDAMWENVMGQRISIVLQAAMAIAVVALCVLVWRSNQENARSQAAMVAQLQQAQADLLQSQQATNAALIERLNDQRSDGATVGNENSDWLSLEFRLVDEHGMPVAGEMAIATDAGSAGQIKQKAVTDADGIVDFGLLPPGGYDWTATVAATGDLTTGMFLLGPGRTQRLDIVCPTAPPPPVELTLTVNPPDELADIPVFHIVELKFGRRRFAERYWAGGSRRLLLANSDGQFLGEVLESELEQTIVSGRSSQSSHLIDVPKLNLEPLRDIPGYSLEAAMRAYVGHRKPELAEDIPLLRRGLDSAMQVNVMMPTAGAANVVVAADDRYWDSVWHALGSMGSAEFEIPQRASVRFPKRAR